MSGAKSLSTPSIRRLEPAATMMAPTLPLLLNRLPWSCTFASVPRGRRYNTPAGIRSLDPAPRARPRGHMVKRVLSRIAYTVVVLLLVLIAIGAVTPQGKGRGAGRPLHTAGTAIGPYQAAGLVRRRPVWRSVTYETAEGARTADIILPADADNNSAVLFFLGVVVNRPSETPGSWPWPKGWHGPAWW